MSFPRSSRAALIPFLCIASIASASHDEFQIWTEANGIVPAPFCEVAAEPDVLDPRMNAYVEGNWRLPDGSEWQAVREDQKLLALDCLENHSAKHYVLFEARLASEETVIQIGVRADEISLFKNAIRIESLRIPPSSKMQKASGLNLPVGVEVAQGALDFVVCIQGKTLNVRDQSLGKILFTVPRHSSAKPVQSFGTDKLKKIIDGVEYTFIKAEFPDLKALEKIGWVAENYLRNRAECPGAGAAPPPVEEPNSNAWTFPTIKRPTSSYKEGMRRFKASRAGGRLHAACDLYRVTGEKAVAISSGKVVRDRYYFYQGTYAIEVKHTGGKVARYGEITGKAAANVGLNKSVQSGQAIGYIGKVNSNCCEPMLHFELYSGTASGALSQSGNSFNRRKDLIDPTKWLVDWEKLKFGTSY